MWSLPTLSCCILDYCYVRIVQGLFQEWFLAWLLWYFTWSNLCLISAGGTNDVGRIYTTSAECLDRIDFDSGLPANEIMFNVIITHVFPNVGVVSVSRWSIRSRDAECGRQDGGCRTPGHGQRCIMYFQVPSDLLREMLPIFANVLNGNNAMSESKLKSAFIVCHRSTDYYSFVNFWLFVDL